MSSENDALPWIPPWLAQSGTAADNDEAEAPAAPVAPTAAPTTPVGPSPTEQHPAPAAPARPQPPQPLPPQHQPQFREWESPAEVQPYHEPQQQPSYPQPFRGSGQIGQGQQPFGQPPLPARQGGQPSLEDVPLLRRAHRPPQQGWRRAVFQVTGGKVNMGPSADEIRVADLVARVRRPARGDYRIAVVSLKGGVGKTTTTVAVGSTFASLRGDRVIAVDANPDFGTLGNRVPQQTRSTVRNLLNDTGLHRYSDVRAHTSQSESRLEVLASERDPATSEAFNEDEYRNVVKILQRYYSVILTDCGTGLMHSAMKGVLDLAQTLVLVSAPAIDGARSAAATLDWLVQHGHHELVANAVVVINSARPDSPHVGMEQLKSYFASRCRAVHVIPFDEHLSSGSEIDLDVLDKKTRRAYLELAASIADDFGK